MSVIGSNKFDNCTIPVAFLNRYLIIEHGSTDLITVILNNNGKAEYEIFRNEPADNSITDATKTPAGVITIADKTGKFIYKIRPASETSIVFGKIEQGENKILINDKVINVTTANGSAMIMQKSTISGFEVGVAVLENGDIVVGTSLPEFIHSLIV